MEVLQDNDKKNLVIATDNFLPRWDGIARFLSEMIPRLSDHYNITIICPDFGAYEDPKIKIVKIPLMKTFKVGDFKIPKVKFKKISEIIKEADIVFTQTIGTIGYVAINAAKKHKKPVASFIHSIEWELVPRAMANILLKKYTQMTVKSMARRIYNKSDILIMPSQNVAELFAWNGIKSTQEIVNLGVDTEKFSPSDKERKSAIRDKLSLDDEDIVIGYHGRISREKDLITLLRAFSRLQSYNKNIKLLIVGDGVEDIKKQLSSRHDVILVGSKNNPVPYLQAMDIYCLTSLTETTCLSLLEAMSCGLAVVSTEVGFIKSYIRNNYNGLFFEKQNHYHLARNIQRLIADESLRLKLGANARQTVIERFNWDKTAQGIINVLEKLERH